MRSFEVGVKGKDWNAIVYAETPGKAKYLRLLDLWEVWDGISLKHLTCREILPCRFSTPDSFDEVARRRGLPFARVGMKVRVDGNAGVIVGSNDSSNFDVYFTDGPHKGTIGNCHPGWQFEFVDLAAGGAA